MFCILINRIFGFYAKLLKKKTKILSFEVQNKRLSKILHGHFEQSSILHSLMFSVECYFKTVHPSSLQTFAFFTQNDVTCH